MKTQKLKSERGQILVLLAVGFVVLLGFVALAVDGGMVLLDRRSAQNAADAAALAGAYKLARNPDDPIKHLTTSKADLDYMAALKTTITNAGLVIANANHYGTSDGNIVTVYYPPASDTIHFVLETSTPETSTPKEDTEPSHYVRVTITSTVNTSFLHFVFSGPVQNTVEAVAHVVSTAKETLFNGSALVALAPTGCGLSVNGAVKANVDGIFVNSNATDAVCKGESQAFQITTPSLKVVGEIGSSVKGKFIDRLGFPVVPISSPAIVYPPGIAMPAVPTCLKDAKPIGPITVPSIPGVTFTEYSPGNMKNWDKNADIYFDPGIYCIYAPVQIHGHLYNDPNDPTGVLLVITGTNPCDFTINGNADLQLSGYRGATYAGLLFYFDPKNFSNPPQGTLTINGSSSININDYINGTFYAPTCSLQVNGGSQNFFQGQVIGYDVTLVGGAAINIPYVADDNIQPLGSAKVDLSQ